MENFHSGTSGLVLPYKNKSFYPPEWQDQSRLEVYSKLFNSIEINSSFYKVPKASTVAKWADIVPDHFRFTFKLSKAVTHNKNLAFEPAAVQQFMQTIDAVGVKKGCLLVQLPPGTKYSARLRLSALLSEIRKYNTGKGWSPSVEFRDHSWYRPETYDLLQQHQATLVIHDKKGSQAPMEDMDVNFVYLRFHGPSGNYRESYDDAYLSEYSYYIKSWIASGKDVYAYFNNTMGDAVRNLRSLNLHVSDR